MPHVGRTVELGPVPEMIRQRVPEGWIVMMAGSLQSELVTDPRFPLLPSSRVSSVQHSPPVSRLSGQKPEGLGRQAVARAWFPCLLWRQ